MSLASFTPSYLTIGSVSVSAPGDVISSVSVVHYKDLVSFQYIWTGNITGTFYVEGSLNYSPGYPQNVSGQANQGNWTAYELSETPTTSSGTSWLVNMAEVATPYIRTRYVHSSGSGRVSAYISMKSTGA